VNPQAHGAENLIAQLSLASYIVSTPFDAVAENKSEAKQIRAELQAGVTSSAARLEA
jgi:hypothetical protein